MSFGVVATIGSAVIGAGATLAASRSASRASSQATQAAQQSNADNIQLARETRDANTALYAGDMARGNAADRYLDILYGVPGLSQSTDYRTQGSSGGSAATNPASRVNWNAYLNANPDLVEYWNRNGGAGTWGANSIQDFAALHYYGRDGQPGGEAGFGESEGRGITYNPETNETAGGEGGTYGSTGMPSREGLQAAYTSTVPYLLTEGQYADTAAEIGRNADEQTGLLNDWRNSSTANNEQDYRTLSGFTDAAINDVSALRERGARDYLDRAGGTFGVTGRLGSVGRDYADSMDRLNQGFATTVRDWRQGDYNPYADRRNFIGDTYQTGARGIAGERGARNLTNIGNRYAGRQSAYGNWEGYLRDQSNRGATGRNAIAGFNGDFRNSAAASNTANANAIAAGAQNASNIYASTAGNLANIFGNAVGSYNYNRNPGGVGGAAGSIYGAGNSFGNTLTNAATNAVSSIWRRK